MNKVLSNTLAVALVVGVAGLTACGGGSSTPAATVPTTTVPITGLIGGAKQGAALNMPSASSVMVTTLAGSAVAAAGVVDGTRAAAQFDYPAGMTTDGTNLYVTECGSTSDIRKIDATGVVTTLAGSAASGSADGTGTAATFACPWGITTDGSSLYVADGNNNMIRKIAPASGSLSAMTSANAVVTTLAGTANTYGSADGTGTAATFGYPESLTTDGSNLYVAANDSTIRKIAPSSGSLSAMTSANAVVTTLAGNAINSGSADGTGTAASFSNPSEITSDGFSLYVTDSNIIRKITPASGSLSAMTSANAVVTTLAGTANNYGSADGTGTAATFGWLYGITTDGTSLFAADEGNNTIRMIVPAGSY